MEFRTIVDIPRPGFEIDPCEPMLFVGSCFADSIGRRFREEGFPVVVNPYGVMYNPVSVLHSVERYCREMLCDAADDDWKRYSADVWPRVVFITLGTNHVYREKATGEIVDNCQKRPQSLFQEELLTVDECAAVLQQAVDLLRPRRPDVRVVFTVSPIRYRKYGYHESQLSKATLLLAVDRVTSLSSLSSQTSQTSSPSQTSHTSYPSYPSQTSITSYFPAYELVMDELRDYRFYAPDMLHPSPQAVDYIWERLVDSYFSAAAKAYLAEWLPLRQALSHKPFQPDSAQYRRFYEATQQQLSAFMAKYPNFINPITTPQNPYE